MNFSIQVRQPVWAHLAYVESFHPVHLIIFADLGYNPKGLKSFFIIILSCDLFQKPYFHSFRKSPDIQWLTIVDLCIPRLYLLNVLSQPLKSCLNLKSVSLALIFTDYFLLIKAVSSKALQASLFISYLPEYLGLSALFPENLW